MILERREGGREGERERGREGERERGREGGRDVDVRKKHQSVASHTCPDQGWNLQPWHIRTML